MVLLCANVDGSMEDNANYWVAGAPGTYSLQATVDDKSAIPETNENNNSKTVTLRVYPKQAENLALNKTVTVTSVESQSYSGNYAVDGSYNTRWSSQFSDPQSITIDLGTVQQFNQIRITWEAAYAKEYTIQTSSDASSWKTIVDQQNGFGNIEKWDVNENARYIRLTGTKRGTQYGYSIYEFEVYNQTTTKVESKEENLPTDFYLSQNYPNPFNPETTIEYSVPKTTNVELKVYDILGQEVATLVNEVKQPGKYIAKFSMANSKFASGIYFYRMSTAGFTLVKKMMLLK
jgi:hypothetical protein